MTFFIGIKVNLDNFCKIVKEPFSPEPLDRHHITLVYLGKRKLPTELRTELKNIPVRTFSIILKGGIAIPSLFKPRVLAAKVSNGKQHLINLREIVLSTLIKHDQKVEDRFLEDFLPHATFARYKGKDYIFASKVAKEILKRAENTIQKVIVSELCLYEAKEQLEIIDVFKLL